MKFTPPVLVYFNIVVNCLHGVRTVSISLVRNICLVHVHIRHQ